MKSSNAQPDLCILKVYIWVSSNNDDDAALQRKRDSENTMKNTLSSRDIDPDGVLGQVGLSARVEEEGGQCACGRTWQFRFFLIFWYLIITVPKKGDHIITRSLEIFLLSGKSTLLNHFKPEQEQNANIVPTVGFNVEKFKSKMQLLLWDSMHQSTFEIKFAPASPCLQLFVVM